MKVSEALKYFGDFNMGYVRMVKYEQAGGNAMEVMLDTFTVNDLLSALNQDCLAFYRIGSYAYIIYKEG